MIGILREFLMVDEVPSTKLAVYLFLEMIALGFALEAVSAFMRGADWWRWAGALLLGIAFMMLGVKSSAIIDNFSHLVDWPLWGKRIAIASQVLFVVSIIAFVVVARYEWQILSRDWHRLEQTLQQKPTMPTTQTLAAPANNTLPTPHKKAASPVSKVPSKYLDWHNKQNWRENLHVGMSRSQVRGLFGPPENMSVLSDMEFWHYGDGGISFDMRNDKDGGLYSWDEPN
jgi:hypothetical protein